MKKLKIYLDTSIISYLDQQDAPEKMAETLRLWEKIQAGEFDVFTSAVAIEELGRCNNEKLFRLKNYLNTINFTLLEKSGDVNDLAKLYVAANVLTQKSFDDCLHIAYACVYNCDMIISWNFKHIVNYKTISGVKSVNAVAGYKEMSIYTPTMLIEKEETDDTL
jgi:predicted nucleic acid-binding protein